MDKQRDNPPERQPYQITGGARIGWVNASYPLATLRATRGLLCISGFAVGSHEFTPDQVVSLEKVAWIPLIAWGVQIQHSVSDYPSRVIFWSWKDPLKVLDGIREAGFKARGKSSDLPERSGMPFRWVPIVAVGIAWNLLFLADIAARTLPIPGPFIAIALGMIPSLCFGVLKLRLLQDLFLKPGRSVKEVAPVLKLTCLVSTLLFSVVLAVNFLHWMPFVR